MTVGDIDLVGHRPCMVVVETKHSDVDLKSRIIVEKYTHSGSHTNIHLEISLISTRKVLTGTIAQFRLASAQLKLDLGKKAETGAAPETYIVAE